MGAAVGSPFGPFLGTVVSSITSALQRKVLNIGRLAGDA
jgi:S1-C subfamily serine protease